MLVGNEASGAGFVDVAAKWEMSFESHGLCSSDNAFCSQERAFGGVRGGCKSNLFAVLAVFLEPPADGEVGTLVIECKVRGNKGFGGAIDIRLKLLEAFEIGWLCPFAEAKTGIYAECKPVRKGSIERGGGRLHGNGLLMGDHLPS